MNKFELFADDKAFDKLIDYCSKAKTLSNKPSKFSLLRFDDQDEDLGLL